MLRRLEFWFGWSHMICHDCKKKARARTCENHNPKGARICKDCCISEMDGHSCVYWEMCWP